jgi:aspartyl-tRNA(Asn)/glutamyl-tRNA(Gln) amidotransferase subunit C
MIDESTVRTMAHLARIEVLPAQIGGLAGEIRRILEYVEQLQGVDTREVPPLTHAAADADVTREDEPRPSLDREDLLALAPRREGPYFQVPKVIEDA